MPDKGVKEMDIKTLNEERKRLGLSVEELAERAGLPKSTLEKILFGVVKNPRIDTVQAIERVLGLDEKKSVIERPTSEIEENFIREYGEQMKEKVFQDIAKLYKAINDANLKMQILAVLVAYLNRNGINTENIVGY